MTVNELNLVLVLRLKYKADPETLAKLLETILGESWVKDIAGDSPHSEQGRRVINIMEEGIGIAPYCSDYYVYEEYKCLACGEAGYYVAPEVDMPVDCDFCDDGSAFKVEVTPPVGSAP